MRLHSIVVSAKYNIPFISLSYDSKNINFAEELGLPELSLLPYSLSSNSLLRTFDYVLKNEDKIKTIMNEGTNKMISRLKGNENKIFAYIHHDLDSNIGQINLSNIRLKNNYLNDYIIAAIRKEYEAYKQETKRLEEKKEEVKREYEAYKQDKESYIASLIDQLNRIYTSDFWKVARTYYKIRDRTSIRYMHKTISVLRRKAIKGLKIITKTSSENIKRKTIVNKILRRVYLEELEGILNSHRNVKGVIIYAPTVDWNIPLFQRPQHLASQLAKQGYLYFFCTPNSQYDKVHGFKQIENRCYITYNVSGKVGQNSEKKVLV